MRLKMMQFFIRHIFLQKYLLLLIF